MLYRFSKQFLGPLSVKLDIYTLVVSVGSDFEALIAI